MRAAIILVFLFAFLPVVCFAQDDNFRTWRDSSGKFSIEAKYVSEADGNVTLEKRDGSTVTIQIDKLSSTDQQVLKRMNEPDAVKPQGKVELTEVSTGDVRIVEIETGHGWSLPAQPAAPMVESTSESIEFQWWSDSTPEAFQKMHQVEAAVVRHPRSPNWLMYAPGGPENLLCDRRRLFNEFGFLADGIRRCRNVDS